MLCGAHNNEHPLTVCKCGHVYCDRHFPIACPSCSPIRKSTNMPTINRTTKIPAGKRVFVKTWNGGDTTGVLRHEYQPDGPVTLCAERFRAEFTIEAERVKFIEVQQS